MRWNELSRKGELGGEEEVGVVINLRLNSEMEKPAHDPSCSSFFNREFSHVIGIYAGSERLRERAKAGWAPGDWNPCDRYNLQQENQDPKQNRNSNITSDGHPSMHISLPSLKSLLCALWIVHPPACYSHHLHFLSTFLYTHDESHLSKHVRSQEEVVRKSTEGGFYRIGTVFIDDCIHQWQREKKGWEVSNEQPLLRLDQNNLCVSRDSVDYTTLNSLSSTHKTSPILLLPSIPTKSCAVTPYCNKRYRNTESVKGPGPVNSSC